LVKKIDYYETKLNPKPDNLLYNVLDELINKYPTDDSLAGFSQREMEEIGKMCEGQVN
jgi:hypothetical protein